MVYTVLGTNVTKAYSSLLISVLIFGIDCMYCYLEGRRQVSLNHMCQFFKPRTWDLQLNSSDSMQKYVHSCSILCHSEVSVSLPFKLDLFLSCLPFSCIIYLQVFFLSSSLRHKLEANM